MDRQVDESRVGGLSASIAFVIGLCSTAMLAVLCCSFYWFRKRCKRTTTSSDGVVPRIRINPVIRSDDVISFVLPTPPNEGSKDQSDRRMAGSESPLSGAHLSMRQCSSAISISELRARTNSPPAQEANGKIGVSLQYDLQRQELTVKVLGCVDLTLRNKKAPDPCVKIALVPDKAAQKFATRTLRSTTNPLFNETFTLPLTPGDLCTSHLKLKVCDRHDLSRYVGQSTSPGGGFRAAVSSSLASHLAPLGWTLVNLSELDLMSRDESGSTRRRVVWCPLKEPSLSPDVVKTHEVATSKGQMLLSLLYDARNGRMTLHIDQVRNLPPQANVEQEKIMVKILLYQRGMLTANSRSKAIRRPSESLIRLDETFVVSLDTKRLHETSCQVLLVSTRSKIGRKRTLGRVTLGHRHFFSTDNKSLSPTGLDHWHDMEHRPGVAIERWHDLI